MKIMRGKQVLFALIFFVGLPFSVFATMPAFGEQVLVAEKTPDRDPGNLTHINWRQQDGRTIRVLLSGHPIQSAIMGLLPEFTALTGIKVQVDVLPEEEFFQKLNTDLEKGRGSVDVFMTSPLYHWRYAQKGWIEGLNQYLDNPAITDRAWYGPADFFPVLFKTCMWNKEIGKGLGLGELYSVPVWWEGSALMYRKDLARQYHFTEPTGWDDLMRQMTGIPPLSGRKMYGFIGRGIRSWSQIHTYHLTMMASQGLVDLNPQTGKAAFNTPMGIAVGEYWVDMMQKAGSPNWSQYNWYEVAAEFQAGKCFAIMDANPFAIMLEAQDSPIRGKVGYLLPPPGINGRQSFLWIWSLGISSHSRYKEAGWLFIQWATGRTILKKAVAYGNWMAPRQSVWFDPEVKILLKSIDNGRWYDNSTRLVTELAQMRWSPHPLAATLGDLWAGGIQDAWKKKCTVKAGLNKAAAEFDQQVKAAGLGK